jgi:CheY-like chemotaxis protein
MKRLLIVEDQPSDLSLAADLAQLLGATSVEARTSASAAKRFVESALEGNSELPDVILLDLDLGYESGYELLRFWYGNPRLAKIRVVIWTVMEEEQRDICRMFKVDAVVPKAAGVSALKQVLEPILAATSQGTSFGHSV